MDPSKKIEVGQYLHRDPRRLSTLPNVGVPIVHGCISKRNSICDCNPRNTGDIIHSQLPHHRLPIAAHGHAEDCPATRRGNQQSATARAKTLKKDKSQETKGPRRLGPVLSDRTD
jgi:hypothetical protein